VAVVRVQRKKGFVYRVRWRDEAGRWHSKTFRLKADADTYDAKVKLHKRRGDLDELDAGKQRFKEFLAEWRHLYAEQHLSPKTLSLYDGLRDRFLLRHLGSFELRRLTPQVIQRFQADLKAQGVGQETIRKTLAMLQGVLERAVEWERLKVNPARVIKKPPQRRSRVVRPLAPTAVEEIRGRLLARKRERDAALISILAYAGLRPGEALALRWGDVRQNVLIVERALSLGELRDTKTRSGRSVKMLRPLATDLNKWRLASGRPGDDSLVFPMSSGAPWTDTAYRNWRSRVFKPVIEDVGLQDVRPYDLRHSLASLLFAERLNPAEIAEQMGHSLQTLLGTYTHVIEELRGEPARSAETLIREARAGRSGPVEPDPQAAEAN
jgi:integrase